LVSQILSALKGGTTRGGRFGFRNDTIIARIPDVSAEFFDHSLSHETHPTQTLARGWGGRPEKFPFLVFYVWFIFLVV
jgi:hypothetical protein